MKAAVQVMNTSSSSSNDIIKTESQGGGGGGGGGGGKDLAEIDPAAAATRAEYNASLSPRRLLASNGDPTAQTNETSSSPSNGNADGDDDGDGAGLNLNGNSTKEEIQCSLLRLFQCKYFDSWLALCYLHRYAHHAGVQDYLCNQLYSFPIEELHFYLPQLCMLLINNTTTNALERLLLDRCGQSMHFAFHASLHLQTYIETHAHNPQADFLLSRCIRLREEMEIAAVNGHYEPNQQSNNTNNNTSSNTTAFDVSRLLSPKRRQQQRGHQISLDGGQADAFGFINHVMLKRRRSSYFDNALLLLDALAQIPLDLVSVPAEQRKTELRNKISQLDKQMTPRGIYMPIDSMDTKHHCIVHISPYEAFLLDSKEGAPPAYIIYLETLESEEKCSSPNTHLFDLQAVISAAQMAKLTPPASPAIASSSPSSENSSLQATQKGLLEEAKFEASSLRKIKSEAEIFSLKDMNDSPPPSASASSPSNGVPSQQGQSIKKEANEKGDEEEIMTGKTQDKNNKEKATDKRSSLETPSASPSSSSQQLQQKSKKENKKTQNKNKYQNKSKAILSNKAIKSEEEEGSASSPSLASSPSPAPSPLPSPSLPSSSSSLPEKEKEKEERSTKGGASKTDIEEERKLYSGVPSTKENEKQKEASKGQQQDSNKRPSIESTQAAFAEDWAAKCERIRRSSPFQHLPGWRLRSFIVKYDECRQEQLASQLIAQFQKIFQAANLPLKLHPVAVLPISSQCGMLETIPDAISLHQLRKHQSFTSLSAYFKQEYGKDPTVLRNIQRNFCQSLAAYSIVTYFLQVKDRHNGNILLKKDGTVVHIDFGYFLSNSPRSLNFESAPFKLTQEFVDVLTMSPSPDQPTQPQNEPQNGHQKDAEDKVNFWEEYKSLCLKAFLEARKHMENILLLVEIALRRGPPLPCLVGGESALTALRERFKRNLTEEQCVEHVESLITYSLDNWRTISYDKYQYLTRGILY
ncbi:Phosphatidylinositol 4-kinase beta [Balamuthia mandrillaris]